MRFDNKKPLPEIIERWIRIGIRFIVLLYAILVLFEKTRQVFGG